MHISSDLCRLLLLIVLLLSNNLYIGICILIQCNRFATQIVILKNHENHYIDIGDKTYDKYRNKEIAVA